MNFLAFGLSNIGSLILFVLIIALLISWHELGHLLVAKKCNVYCYEYAIGFGPALFTSKKRETHFSIRAIPLGGFVKMAGEEGVSDGEVIKGNNGEEIPSNRILANQAIYKRALVMAAGGIMNMILAVVCFYFVISVAGGFNTPRKGNDVFIVNNEDLATMGMETGDKIIKIETKLGSESEYVVYETKNINDIFEAIESKRPEEKEGNSQDIRITYLDVSNNNEQKVIDVNKTWEKNEEGTLVLSQIGLQQNYNRYEYNFLTATYGVWHYMGYCTVETIKAFGGLFAGKFDNLSGLIGMYGVVDEVATSTQINFMDKVINLIALTGSISFSLGFFNLIPFPALDGGRLFFLAIEGIFKKKVNPNVEATIHTVGLVLLFGLMIIINIRDIIKLF